MTSRSIAKRARRASPYRRRKSSPFVSTSSTPTSTGGRPGFLAARNEQLESKARQEALRAIEEAARHGDVMEKARRQAERQLQQLFEKFGVTRTTIGWRPA